MQFKNTGDFLKIMDEESQELHELSVGLFDKYSNIDGGAKSSLECWSTDLSVGDVFFFIMVEDVLVKEEVCSFLLLFVGRSMSIVLDFYLVQTM